mmetsp:Transcript_34786/g.88388  ORF Transcript_34786/g.88388 Transcript_34786/m.88388 type:complete len:287 (-) Transcript_34786:364-1224(-)
MNHGDAACLACLHGASASLPHHSSCTPYHARQQARAGFQAREPEAGARNGVGSPDDEPAASEQPLCAWRDRPRLAKSTRCRRHRPASLNSQGSEGSRLGGRMHPGDASHSACMHGALASSPSPSSCDLYNGCQQARAGFQAQEPEAGARNDVGSPADEPAASEQPLCAWHDHLSLAKRVHGPRPHLPGLSSQSSEGGHPKERVRSCDGACSAYMHGAPVWSNCDPLERQGSPRHCHCLPPYGVVTRQLSMPALSSCHVKQRPCPVSPGNRIGCRGPSPCPNSQSPE